MGTVDKYNLQQAKYLANLAKVEHGRLTKYFSDHALLEIGKNVVKNNGDCNLSLIVSKYLAELNNQLNSTYEDQKELLQGTLESDCEYPLDVIAEMTPRQKINNYLFYNGIEGFTDDILDAISAAYGIILEPDLDR